MKKKLKVMALLLGVFLLLVACKKEDAADSNKDSADSTKSEASDVKSKGANNAESKREKDQSADDAASKELSGLQFEKPAAGDTIAEIVMKDFGTIKIRFFEKDAPKAVENFITHAKDGFYDGLVFHRIINDFMIQGGDPTGTGTGGESIWGKAFEDEISQNLFPYRGALCMANSGANTNGSQFFIVQNGRTDESLVDQLKEGEFPDEMINNYKLTGGTPWLYGKHTVFGQVIEGLEIVDAIAAVKTDSEGKPEDQIVIEKINITEFK